MRKDYLVMLDTETSGRVYFANGNVLRDFASVSELLQSFHTDTDPEYVLVDWQAPMLTRGKLLTLRIAVLHVDGSGVHGFVINGGNQDVFTNDNALRAIMEARIRMERIHQERCKKTKKYRQPKPCLQLGK